ncbi:TPA: response regulator [Candidatus Poribacteria bacterium]|nr:response regulator [Candidatus Poribacteria bacterium]
MVEEKPKIEYEEEIKRLRLIMDISRKINSQPTLSDTARVIVESLKEIGFDRASVWVCDPNEDVICELWGTDINGNICKSEKENPIDSIPPHHGYTIDIDPAILKDKLGIDGNSNIVFLNKDSEEDKFASVWGYHPPSPGFYKRDENGDNICICVRDRDKNVGMIAVDNYITKRNIDETSANLFSIVGAEMAKALANVALRESLFAEKERLAVTLRSIGDGVIVTDVNENILLMNAIAEKLTGWAEVSALGKPLREIFQAIDEKSGKPIDDLTEKAIKTGEIVQFPDNTILLAKNDEEILISDSIAPIRDTKGNIIGAVLVFRDETEKRKIEEELIKAQKLDSIGILAGGIAHDFNNMLTGILGNISLARMYLDPNDKAFKRLEDAERATMEARKLTQQLLTFSKGGAPILKVTSIKELLIDSTNFALKGSNVKCKFLIPDNLWSVEIDGGQISQVINNIVINAIQAMPSGGTIEVGAENITIDLEDCLPLKSGKYVKIYIKDYGIGIPKKYLQRIFDPYFTTKQKGSGLGLSTAYTIIKKHDGHIDVESELEVGSTFYIYLPAKTEYYSEELTRQYLNDKLRILIVDDQEIIRDLVQAILGNVGHEVFVAEGGDQAINLYKSELENGRKFDLIIMDLTIPGEMGGKEAIVKLKELDPNVKAIVSSGYSDDPVMSDYEHYGFDGCIVKPYKNKDLIEIVQNVMLRKG